MGVNADTGAQACRRPTPRARSFDSRFCGRRLYDSAFPFPRPGPLMHHQDGSRCRTGGGSGQGGADQPAECPIDPDGARARHARRDAGPGAPERADEKILGLQGRQAHGRLHGQPAGRPARAHPEPHERLGCVEQRALCRDQDQPPGAHCPHRGRRLLVLPGHRCAVDTGQRPDDEPGRLHHEHPGLGVLPRGAPRDRPHAGLSA